MFVNHIQTNLPKQFHSDNDDDCSCSSCECSSFSDDNHPMPFNNPIQSMNMPPIKFIHKQYHPTSNISHINNSLDGLNRSDRFSINSNRPSIESKIENTSTNRINEHQSEDIYKIIDQSYTKIPIFYNSIHQTKLDPNFIFSLNDYLDRLKGNIYKDLIRRETLLRNGKLHTRNLISLIRCLCKISSEQANEIPNNLIPSKHAALYTMTAIDYILQNHFPQKKSLFNYILNEYISMWLHENLRIIQEDFCIILENGTNKNFLKLCNCILNKLESICAINWERLQMIQNYRLTHFDQLLKPTSIKLEINQDFILLFGKSLKLTMKKSSEIPITSLYSNRTDNELINIEKIHYLFRKSIAKILIEDEQKSMSGEITTPTSIIEKSAWNIISETQTIEPPRHSSPTFSSDSSLSHSQTSTKSGDTSPPVKTMEVINRPNEPIPPLTSINLLPQSLSDTSTPIIFVKSESPKSNSLQEPPNLIIISPEKPLTDDHFSSLSHQTLSDKILTTDSKTILNAEINALIHFLTELADSPSSIQQRNETSPLIEQLESCLKENNTDPNSIIEKIHTTHPQSSLSVKDPLFLAEFTRVLRKELEDAQILREIECGQSNEGLQNIGYLSFETINILKLPNANTSRKKKETAAGDNIDQNRIFIEVTHDPSRCSPNHEFSYPKYHSCTLPSQQFNHNSSLKSTVSSKSTNQQSSPFESNHSQQRWYWIRSNENILSKDCLITPNSLSCVRNSLDKNTYSITVEHNEEFR